MTLFGLATAVSREVESWTSKAENFTAHDWFLWLLGAGNEHIVLRVLGGLVLLSAAVAVGIRWSWRRVK